MKKDIDQIAVVFSFFGINHFYGLVKYRKVRLLVCTISMTSLPVGSKYSLFDSSARISPESRSWLN